MERKIEGQASRMQQASALCDGLGQGPQQGMIFREAHTVRATSQALGWEESGVSLGNRNPEKVDTECVRKLFLHKATLIRLQWGRGSMLAQEPS
eukprot:1161342-Pelagomonas_calceolata.AAC.2